MNGTCSTGETLPIAISIITYGIYVEDYFCRMEEAGKEDSKEAVRQVIQGITHDRLLDLNQRPEVEEALRLALEEIIPGRSDDSLGIESLTLHVLNWDIQNQA